MRIVISLIILVIFSINSYAKIPKVFVSVNPKEIQSGDKVELILGALAKKNAKMSFPKVEEIDKNSVLKRKSTVTHSIEEIKGKKTPLTKRTITHTIRPKKDFEVPIFTIKIDGKEYKTVPFKVKVLNNQNSIVEKETASTKPSKQNEDSNKDSINSDFIFKMSSNKSSVVVGESFIVKVELFEPIDLSSSDLKYTPPKFNGFNATPLGDGKTLERGDSVIRTIEYLVTAKKAGVLTIKPAQAKVGIQVTAQVQSPFGFFGADVQWKNLSTKPLKINVKKAPSEADLIGKYRIKAILDSKSAKLNKPFNYTIQIEGIGNLDDIKDPNLKIKNITSYSDDSNIEHIINNNKIYSKYTKKYVFISDKDFTIPAIEYKVYSPSLKKLYTLKTEPFLVKVTKSRSITNALNNKNRDIEKEKVSTTKIEKSSNTPKNNISTEQENEELDKVENLLFDKHYYKYKYSKKGYPFSAIIGALFLGIILGVGGMVLIPSLFKINKFSKNRDRLYNSYEEALNILYPHTTSSKNIENMVEQLYEVVSGNNEIKIDDFALNKMIKEIKGEKK